MYRVGDYVYFENSASGPYAVRRIEELNKTANGNVEARVICFYRRNEVPASLIPLADKHHWGEVDVDPDSDDEDAMEEETERTKHKQRELFLSRQIETLPATLIRGKCSVTLLCEVELVSSYLKREDAFFYALVYDPHQKTLLADRGSIRIGSEYQAQLPKLLKPGEKDAEEDKDIVEEEETLWKPNNELNDEEINQFIIIARSVGTFARALDCSSSVKQPSLHMSAAAASRDITVFHAYQALHAHNYDLSAALATLVPTTGPVLCRDEMEDWSSAEANLFEEAIQKYGKDFNDIKKDFLPWKSMKNIIEYFFMWKTTDRYVQQKRIKALESEKKLKQVYIPSYNRKSTRVTGPQGEVMVLGRDCDAYPKMAKYSWSQYKKFGRFISAVTTDDCFIIDRSANSVNSKLNQLRPGLIIEPGSPSKNGKTRAAFFLRTTPLTRAARRVCNQANKMKHFARRPTEPLDLKLIRTESLALLVGEETVRKLCTFKKTVRAPMSEICRRLGQTDQAEQAWLVLPSQPSYTPDVEAYPRPSKNQDGSYIYEKIPDLVPAAPSGGSRHSMLYKKRAYEEKPAEGPNPAKHGRSGTQTRNYSVNQVAPKGKIATLTRINGGEKTIVTWQDAPDDLFYRASPKIKKMRKHLTTPQLRKAARKPFRKILSQN